MTKFVFAYHGTTRPKDGAQFMMRWKAWVKGLGGALVSPGLPLGQAKTISKGGVTDGGGSNPLAGFSIIEAESLEAALALASDSPHLEIGTIEVAEALDMPMS